MVTTAPEPVAAGHAAVAAASQDRICLGCMDIWGGNEQVADAISVAGIDAWIYSDPFAGDATGGDVHYVSTCGAGNISRFAVADVAGHGDGVNLLARRLRKLMRKHINTPNQMRFARALNKEFSQLSREGRFATALLTTYYAPTDQLIVVNAGHPKPLWYRVATGRWQFLDCDSPACKPADRIHNLPLGVIAPTDYVQFAVNLDKGDLVLMFTDALIEATDEDNRQIGEAGLLELVQSLDHGDLPGFGRRLLDAVADYRGGRRPEDDQTLMVLHHNAADPPPTTLGDKFRVTGKMLGLLN